MTAAALLWLSAVFAWTAFRQAGVEPADWNISVLALVLLAALFLPRAQAPPLPRSLAWPLLLLLAWVLFQLAPLPLPVVQALSPARAALASAAGETAAVPLSVAPALTLAEWMRLAGCLLVFLIVRELAWRCSEHRAPWLLALPLVAVACLEALLGLAQFYTAAAPGAAAQGTYGNRDHFAGLMEMALPFPVMYGIAALWRARRRFETPLRPALAACLSFAAAALLLLGSIHSLSRMGFIAALFSLAVLAAAALPHKRWLLAAPAALLALFIYLPPDQLIARFADLSTVDKVLAQDRAAIWRQSLPLAAAYPLSGCGLGAFESAFMSYKRTAPLATDNAAHNDYLQYFAELGAPAFLLGLFLLARLLAAAARAAGPHNSPSARALSLASLASISALLLHSLVDFNSYIPGNAFAFAWIAAISLSAGFSSRPASITSCMTIDIQPPRRALRQRLGL